MNFFVSSGGDNMMRKEVKVVGYKGRDVEVAFLDEGRCLVAACDSCGAIGDKELDVVKVPSYVTGRFTARVALLEVLAAAAVPQFLTAAISNEASPTGEGILAGVADELKSVEIPSLPMVVSTEKNMPTRQTALGISVVGVCREGDLRIATSQPGDNVYCLGLPKVGPEVKTPDDPEIVQGKHVIGLLAFREIHDVVPVGSQGIRREAEMLAANVDCEFMPHSSVSTKDVDWDKSAGPSTCLIFTSPLELTAVRDVLRLASRRVFGSIPLYQAGKLVP